MVLNYEALMQELSAQGEKSQLDNYVVCGAGRLRASGRHRQGGHDRQGVQHGRTLK